MAKVILVSGDKTKIETSLAAIQHCELIKNALSHDEDSPDVPDTEVLGPVEIDRIDGDTLTQVVAFLEQQAVNPMKELSDPIANTFDDNVPQEFYNTFVDQMGQEGLFRVREAANFMMIPQLINLTNLWLTFHLEGKTVDEIHEILGIPRLSEEEERQARQEHPWLFDEAEIAEHQ